DYYCMTWNNNAWLF
nr:immunoglobulin light chain junction region [Macaca mulatta]